MKFRMLFYWFMANFLLLVFAFSILNWMVHPMRGEMNVYVPDDFELSSMEYNSRHGPGGIVIGYNNTEIKIVNVMSMYGSGVDNPDELEKYKGKRVCVELSWGSTDDENWYIKTITDVKIIDNSTELSKIKDIGDIKFNKDVKMRWGLNITLSLIATTIMTVYFLKEAER